MKVLVFANAKEIMGFDEMEVTPLDHETAREVLERIRPGCMARLKASRVALDREYAGWDVRVGDAKEMAVIPQVSGG